MDSSGVTAAQVIARLDLQPHPEGGYFRETFRDHAEPGQRAASTAIYFLLEAGVISRWHRVDAVEVWHWYAGAPLALSIADGSGASQTIRLGSDVLGSDHPQVVVPAHHWQQAGSLGAWTLAGCTVSPGFTFDGFEIAAPGFQPNHPA